MSAIDIVNGIWAGWDQTVPGIVAAPEYYASNQKLLEAYIAKKRSEEIARRNSIAKAFNDAVNAYNAKASDIYNRSDSFYKDIYGRNIAQIKDRSEYGTLGNLSTELGQLTFNETRPTFGNTFSVKSDNSAYDYDIGDIPALLNIDSSYSSKANSSLSSARNALDRLYSDRAAEENRISQFFSTFERDLGQASEKANQINFADLTGMNAGRATQNDLEGRLGGFSSLLNPDTAGLRTSLNNFDTRLDQLFADRSAEEGRIADFRSGISKAFAPVRDESANYTIRDYDKIVGGSNTLDDLTNSVKGFSSLLNPSFNDELSGISSTKNKLTNLLTQRNTELKRIEDAQKGYFEKASGLTNEANNAGIYSKSALDSLQGKVGGLEKEIGGFSSLLDFNFGDANKYLSDAKSRISSLYGERSGALANIGSAAAKSASGLSDVPLYNEDELNTRKGSISQQISALNNFTGDDVDPTRKQAQSALDSVLARLNELYGYRTNLEGKAQTYLNDLNNRSFYDSASVQKEMAADTPLDALKKEIGLYRATQADDEISSIGNRYNAELARLLLDERAKSERAAAEAKAVTGRSTGNVPLYSKGIPLTDEEYQAYILGRRRQQDELQNQKARMSSFSKALGLVG